MATQHARRRWPPAASTTRSAAASTATRPTPQWLVPHFEKMLYDNALLALAYLEAYQVDRPRRLRRRGARHPALRRARDEPRRRRVLLGDRRRQPGARRTSRARGWFFTWTPAEIERRARRPRRARRVGAVLRRHRRGQLRGPQHPAHAAPLDAVAQELGIAPAALRATLAAARDSLYAARARRPPPLRDDKVLAAWNGLMISAFARAALVLDEPSYAQRAARAADFVLGRMRVDGRLRAQLRRTAPRDHDAYLDDYAFMIAGLLDLYEATASARWLDEAIDLDRVLGDALRGRRPAASSPPATTTRRCWRARSRAYDGAEPSGNSVAGAEPAAPRTSSPTDDRYRQRAERTLRAFARAAGRRAGVAGGDAARPRLRPRRAEGDRHRRRRRRAPRRRRCSPSCGASSCPTACWWSPSRATTSPTRPRACRSWRARRRCGGQGDRVRVQAAGVRAADVGSRGVRPAVARRGGRPPPLPRP